ncbi:PF09979 family protein [Leptospira weilii serovar Topaz str. LT2116]|uniref:PF09979 family protein n=1 Tax=Leptospira weilii serovar Topaz str. LT2116 TaxID=1088540 RepID=M3GZB9_9LEPT|nr:PF09979 family protein [Leptospira weilii serovar Topaz str. LT2116]
MEVIETDEGFLRAFVTIARTGVFPYLRSGKICKEAKLPEELFSKETLDTIKLKPVADGHPPTSDNRGLIVPENFKKYVIGTLGDSVEVIDNKRIRTIEIVYDSKLIGELKAGEKREVSIGFECYRDETPGVFEGEQYDVVQREISINHLSHVPHGRAGEEVTIHLDSADEIGIQLDEETMSKLGKKTTTQDEDPTQGDPTSPTEEQISKGILKVLGSMFSKLIGGSEEAEPSADDKKNSELQSQIDALKKENEELKKKGASNVQKPDPNAQEQDAALEEQIRNAANERIQLIETGKAVIPEFKADGLSNREIRLKVIETILPSKKVAKDEKDEIVNAVFDAAVEVAGDKFFVNKPDATSVRIDEADIEKLRIARLDMREVK